MSRDSSSRHLSTLDLLWIVHEFFGRIPNPIRARGSSNANCLPSGLVPFFFMMPSRLQFNRQLYFGNNPVWSRNRPALVGVDWGHSNTGCVSALAKLAPTTCASAVRKSMPTCSEAPAVQEAARAKRRIPTLWNGIRGQFQPFGIADWQTFVLALSGEMKKPDSADMFPWVTATGQASARTRYGRSTSYIRVGPLGTRAKWLAGTC